MPQRSIKLPANTKEGMASKTQLCEPDTSAEENCCIGYPPIQRPAMPATPSANTIGIDSRTSTTNMMATLKRSMTCPDQCVGSPCGSGEIIIAKP